MDPDTALRKLRDAVRRLDHSSEGQAQQADVDSAVDHFEALDQWLCRGGFLPHDWQRDT